ncbi:hypothetical protein VHEMI03045 [[Torrubiella] hemipterigena]|uniref:Ferric oxidoreductase domain-containing protein n=1 Tax=[Torrubiella] hemipterigena TaxID=1531966 RepID=A0A0A1SXE7_9HYPO|nr:hypothetical protein VHEMI03045 [[Torrubiella] hemipterigena]
MTISSSNKFSTMRVNLLTLALAATCAAKPTGGRRRYGVIGYGISMYDPPCAYACIDTIKRATLNCMPDHDMDMDMHMEMPPSTPECKATNDPYLTTMAWCFHTHCADISKSTLEYVWETDIVGRLAVQPAPKYGYMEALSRVKGTPTRTLAKAMLNDTMLVNEKKWLGNFNGVGGFETMERLAEKYAIILMSTIIALPVFLSCASLLPLPKFLHSGISAFLQSPAFGTSHATPILGLGFVPTRGQALYILVIWVLNIVFSAAGYVVRDPMSWYETLEQQILVYISNRVGVLSFVNLALAVLFSTRNNPLLWLTNWSHSTYLLIHRWIAVISVLQACLHSALYLAFYLDPANTEGNYADESKLDYWIWGIVATLSLALLLPFSIFKFRQELYSVFLASHLTLAILAMIGCLLHIYYRYEWQWGYETWVLIAFAFWGFDRVLARPLRILLSGRRRAYVTALDDDYLQLVIPEVEAEGHVYLYFPTLTWRFWESNPFSVVRPGGCSAVIHDGASESGSSSKGEKNAGCGGQHGLELLVRKMNGVTKTLAQYAGSPEGVLVWVEGSYGSHTSVMSHHRPSLEYPNTLVLAGGVGIAGVLHNITDHPAASFAHASNKLVWVSRSQALVDRVRSIIGGNSSGSHDEETWGNFQVSVSVGNRVEIASTIRQEVEGVKGGTRVLICGPGGMIDEARMAVAMLVKQGHAVCFVEESFIW